MNLDVNTLFLVTIYVEAILGLLLLFAWVQNTSIRAVAWWGFAHLLRASSVMLFGMYGRCRTRSRSISPTRSVHGVRTDLDRRARVRRPQAAADVLLFGGAALWLVACRVPGVADSFDLRVLL